MIYQVYVGNKSKMYDHCVDSVATYAKRIGADHVVQCEPILKIAPDTNLINNPKIKTRSRESFEKHGGFLPIYEKENAFGYLDEYDQIAIIDADVYVRPNSPSVFDDLKPNIDFAASAERDMPFTDTYYKKILGYSKQQYKSIEKELRVKLDWDPKKGCEFMNMGVMLITKGLLPFLQNQSPTEFIRRKEFKRFVDGLDYWKWSTDQTLLNYWIRKEPIKYQNLHWKWNGMYQYNTKIEQCHFVHFVLRDKLPQRGENIHDLMKLIGE